MSDTRPQHGDERLLDEKLGGLLGTGKRFFDKVLGMLQRDRIDPTQVQEPYVSLVIDDAGQRWIVIKALILDVQPPKPAAPEEITAEMRVERRHSWRGEAGPESVSLGDAVQESMDRRN